MPLKLLISFVVVLISFAFLPNNSFAQGADCNNPLFISPPDTSYQNVAIDMTGMNSYFLSFNAPSSAVYFEVSASANGEFPEQFKLYENDCNGGGLLATQMLTDSNGVKSLEIFSRELSVNTTYIIEVVQNTESSVQNISLSYYDLEHDLWPDPIAEECAEYMYNGSFEIKRFPTNNKDLFEKVHFSHGYLLLNNIRNRADYYTPYANHYSTPFGQQVNPPKPSTNNLSYAGLWAVNTYLNDNHYTGEFREWTCGQLLSDLEPNQKYYVSMYVRLTNGSRLKTQYFTGSVPPGIKFTSQSTVSKSQVDIVNMTADIQPTNVILPNQSGPNPWIKIEGYYTATGNEDYVTVANFLPDAQSFNENSGFANQSYFFIDLISIKKADECCLSMEVPDGSDEEIFDEERFDDFVTYDFVTSTRIIDGINLNINGTFTVTENLTFKNSSIKMGPLAKINVINGDTLTIDSSELKVCADSMWKGIEVANTDSKVIMNESELWDAQKGILSTNGGNFAVTNSFFNRNEHGIYIDTYLGNQHPGTISGTTFKGDERLLKPSVTGNAVAGIYLNRVANYNASGGEIVIGNTTKKDNIFIGPDFAHGAKGMPYGIYSNVSSFNVVNTTFKQFGNFTAVNVPERAAIKVIGGLNTITSNPPVDIVPTINIGYNSLDTSEQNKFLNTTKAIDAIGNQSIHIHNNHIELSNNPVAPYVIDYEIDIRNNSADERSKTRISILNNKITEAVNGIRFKSSNLYEYKINANTIELLNGEGNTGIYVYDVGRDSSCNINENIISKATRGIYFEAHIANIINNHITLNTTINNNQPNYGIKVHATNFPTDPNNIYYYEEVSHNTIIAQQPSSNTKVYGIYILSPTERFAVNCNGIFDVGTALYFDNIQQIFNWSIRNNYLKAENCFVIDNYTVLGDIGTLYSPSDNTFYRNSSGWDTYAENADGNLTILYTRSGLPHEPMKNGHSPSWTSIDKNPNASGEIYNCMLIEEGLKNSSSSSQNVVVSTVPDFKQLYQSDTIRWMAKYQYYQSILNESIASKSVQAFKDSVDLAALGKLMSVKNQLLSPSKTTMALNSISTTVPQENLLKTVLHQLQLEKSQSWDTLPATAKSVLEPIAQACPYENGPAVYEARALIYAYTGKLYYNPCEGYSTPTKAQKRLKSIGDLESDSDKIAVYPNPTNNNLTVEVVLEKTEIANFEVYDLKGRLLLEQTLNKDKSNLSLDGLASGIYLYWIKNQKGKVLKKDKLVIQ